MKLGIVGGALQGIEAAYLARKAGYESFVIDRREDAPARSLADGSATVDVAKDTESARRLLSDCDAVIPALEDLDALRALDAMRDGLSGPLLFDLGAYDISSSKKRSNEIMAKYGVPMPRPWPECGFPVIVKPSCQSGSVGVSEVDSREGMEAALKKVSDLNDTPVVQEFVHGKSISIEVIGNGCTARSYITTEVVLDRDYDCKQVLCNPGILGEEEDTRFGMCAKMTAEDMGLNGIMDMEAIDTPGGFRVLEIDARLPSQTPAAILAGTGINLLDELYRAASGKDSEARSSRRWSSYEHFHVTGGKMLTCGEKKFSHVRTPALRPGLFGADEMVTDYREGSPDWYAIMINSADSEEGLRRKREDSINQIMKECQIGEFVDLSPEVV